MIYLLALLALTLLPSPVHAQSSGPPTFSVGDEWTLSTGLVRKVMKIDGDNVVKRVAVWRTTDSALANASLLRWPQPERLQARISVEA